MKIAIHQPHVLPWLGYLHKAAHVDVFVILDTVQFQKHEFQNRNYILAPNGKAWLTIPVNKSSLGTIIADKLLATDNVWRDKVFARLNASYGEAPHWNTYGAEFEKILYAGDTKFVSMAVNILDWMWESFQLGAGRILSSELGARGASTDLILDICRRAGAKTYLSGPGARSYLDVSKFEESGVSVEWQEFKHPVYTQKARRDAGFVPGLAAIDLLFNEGTRAREILLNH